MWRLGQHKLLGIVVGLCRVLLLVMLHLGQQHVGVQILIARRTPMVARPSMNWPLHRNSLEQFIAQSAQFGNRADHCDKLLV
jgi:hypothetical protein